MLRRVSSVCCLNGDFEDRVCENMQIFGRICGLPGNFNILIGGAVSKILLFGVKWNTIQTQWIILFSAILILKVRLIYQKNFNNKKMRYVCYSEVLSTLIMHLVRSTLQTRWVGLQFGFQYMELATDVLNNVIRRWANKY